MAYHIKNIKGAELAQVKIALQEKLNASRFTVDLETAGKRLVLRNIRLRESKHYCGNHPLPCPVRPFPTRHIHAKFLEGTDWVAFNDGINDLLDSMGVSADVASAVVTTRKGEERCVEYFSQTRNGIDNEWEREGVFNNYMNQKAPPSLYPDGTPGLYQWEA